MTKRKQRSASSARKPCGAHGLTCYAHDGAFWLDSAAADRAVEFFATQLHHVKGQWAGESFMLQPWQADGVIRPVFGWRRSDGTRRYRTVYIEVPRKNGKSTISAGIALYLLFADGEQGAEVYSAAADRDQAGMVFEPAKAMVLANPETAKRAEVYRRAIVVPSTGSAYRVLSADAPTKHGLNAHGIIFDELHAQPNRELYDVLHTSMGARQQPLEVLITTAGYDRHSICWELHSYAEKVRDGIVEDPTFLPVIYGAGEADDWTAEATWRKANPSYDVTIRRDYLEDECRRAKEQPAYENTFKRLHLNLWTEQAVRWMPMEKWDLCNGATDREALVGRECFGGLDLATTTDIAAFVLVFPGEDGFDVVPYFWVPAENAHERSRRDRVPYDEWIRSGLIEATEGNVVDYDVIRKRVNEIGARFNLREIAFDPWNATQIATQLEGDGFAMVQVRQGFQSLTEPTKALMALVLDRALRHGGHPVLRWMASNVSVKQDPAGNLKPDKGKSTEKIDGIVALVMALSRAIVASDGTSVYESRGVVCL